MAFAHSRSRAPRPEDGQQFGQRDDAGQRRADIVRDAGKRGLDGARRRRGRALARRHEAADAAAFSTLRFAIVPYPAPTMPRKPRSIEPDQTDG